MGRVYRVSVSCKMLYPSFLPSLVEPSQIVLSHGAAAHESQILNTTFRDGNKQRSGDIHLVVNH